MQTNQEHEKDNSQEKKAANQKQERPANSDQQQDSPEFRSRRAFLGTVIPGFRRRSRSS